MLGPCAAARRPPCLVEHLSRSTRVHRPWPGLGGLGGLGGSSTARLMTAVRGAPTAQRLAGSLDPLTPLWQLSELPAGEPRRPRRRAVPRRRHSDGGAASRPAAETFELAVDYAKDRHQFGRPIGCFQAIKHMCADMLVRAEAARAGVHAAACRPTRPMCSPRKLRRRATTPVASMAARRAGAVLRPKTRSSPTHATCDPGPRRHGLHLGGAAAPAPQAVALLATTFGTAAELSSLLGAPAGDPAA